MKRGPEGRNTLFLPSLSLLVKLDYFVRGKRVRGILSYRSNRSRSDRSSDFSIQKLRIRFERVNEFILGVRDSEEREEGITSRLG